jgi:hypothetical protein
MSIISKVTDSNTHKCDWCGSPHMTHQCFRKNPCNVHLFPLPYWPDGIPPQSILVTYSKPQPRDSNWYLAHRKPTGKAKTTKSSSSHPVHAPTSPVSSHTGAQMRAFSTLQTLSDINDTYARDFEADQNKRTFGPCTWCTSPTHTMDRCYGRDPENLTRYPDPRWINGEIPQRMRRRYYKKFTQEEATHLGTRQVSPWYPTRVIHAVSPDHSTPPGHFDLDRQSSTSSSPSPQDDTVVKQSSTLGWLSRICWRTNWFS